MQKVLLLINTLSNNGNGIKKWNKIKPSIYSALQNSKIDEVLFSPPDDISLYLHNKIYNKIIFGGGDGTFHHGINICINNKIINENVSFGAIGLGSSNDLHKPFSSLVKNIPVKISSDYRLHDIGKVVITLGGNILTKYFIINASIGVAAFGNYLFNNPDFILRIFKSYLTNTSIFYASIKSILLYKNIPVEMGVEAVNSNILLSSANVVKSPHISGGLCFDQNILPDDGLLGLHICENMNKMELVKTFIDLSNGKFSGKPKRTSYIVNRVTFKCAKQIPLELDGEIYIGDTFTFELLPKYLKICK